MLRVDKAGLAVAEPLANFIDEHVIPGTGLKPDSFWVGAAGLFNRFSIENRRLLDERLRLQEKIDAWHDLRRGTPMNRDEYQSFLLKIGYLVPQPAPFEITTSEVDIEVAALAGPQLVVPILNDRFLLNAANARWGSLYDALYGTDALGSPPDLGTYDETRGACVVAHAKAFLDQAVPLATGCWADFRGGELTLADPAQLVGRRGETLLFRHNGLHIEVVIDRDHPVGRNDPAGVADVILESALTTICDLEDSIAAVDAEDKVAAYANWLGLMKGNLTARFVKNGEMVERQLEPDRTYSAPDGRSEFTLPGRALLFVRNVGHLMTTPAVLLADGAEAPEGILDGIVTALIALHDLNHEGRRQNSRAGAVYIVKPKMHGPAEAAFTDQLFDEIEDLLGMPRHTLKVGLMDEERRTSANLAACIEQIKGRVMFINTGFLDRTGDEIHTSMRAGAMIRKGEMRASTWIDAYEKRNVAIGLACGFAGKAQIGKGMWAAPDRMGEMLDQKIRHPQAGATAAWVPSPTAATLHALHYHAVDVLERQRELKNERPPSLEALLTIPLADAGDLTNDEIAVELDNNAQGILGYVVRWVDQGIGCSKVPDINDIGLMEDRATLRISAQHIANWMFHGVVSRSDVESALRRMAAKVDKQNAGDPAYAAMEGRKGASLAFQAARALVLEGCEQPNGYTEPLLHGFRQRAKMLIARRNGQGGKQKAKGEPG